jgi:hypothetical protein
MTKLRLPPNCIDVTDQAPGTVITLVGAESIRKQIAAGHAPSLANRPTVPQGFKDVTRERGGVRAIIGYPSPTTDGSLGFPYNNPIKTKLRRVAYHEAGHAVCGRTLGLASGDATITSDGTGLDGHAVIADHHTIHNDFIASGGYRDFQSSVCLKIMVSLSGSEAERIAGCDDADLDGDDRAHVLDLCRRYYISDATVEDLRHRTHSLLVQHWHKVEAVADALLGSLRCPQPDWSIQPLR